MQLEYEIDSKLNRQVILVVFALGNEHKFLQIITQAI